MNDDNVGVVRELVNILSEHNSQIQKRLIETYAILEHFIPKVEGIDKSIIELQSLISKQENLIERFALTINESQREIVNNLKESIVEPAIKIQKRGVIFLLIGSILVLSSLSFFLGFNIAN